MSRIIEVYYWDAAGHHKIYSTEDPENYNIVPGVIKKEVNKAGSFEFDIYDFQTFRHNLIERITYISVENAGYDRSSYYRYMFYGRVTNVNVSLNGQWHVTCEGLLSDLMDVPLYMPSNESGGKKSKYGIWRLYTESTDYLFWYALRAYIELSGRTNIRIGGVAAENVQVNENENEDDDNWFNYEYPWSQTVGDFLLSELVNTFGGIIEVIYGYDSSKDEIYGTINWAADPISDPDHYPLYTNTQKIEYGENVLDASIENQNTDPIEAIFPTWSKKEYIKTTADNDTVNKEEIKYYLQSYNGSTGHYMPGLIYPKYTYYKGAIKHVNFDAAHSESSARTMAEKYLNAYHKEVNYNITAKVLDRYYLGDNVWRIEIMTKYRVIIPFPGKEIDAELFCLSYEFDVSDFSNSTYVFGSYVPPDILKTRYLTGR